MSAELRPILVWNRLNWAEIGRPNSEFGPIRAKFGLELAKFGRMRCVPPKILEANYSRPNLLTTPSVRCKYWHNASKSCLATEWARPCSHPQQVHPTPTSRRRSTDKDNGEHAIKVRTGRKRRKGTRRRDGGGGRGAGEPALKARIRTEIAGARSRLTAAHPTLAEGADALPPCIALASIVPCGLSAPVRVSAPAVRRADVL